MSFAFFIFLFICAWLGKSQQIDHVPSYIHPEHALNNDLFNLLKECDTNQTFCRVEANKISLLSTKIANEHAALLLYDRALDIFDDVLYFMQSDHEIGKRAAHILAVLRFAQGRTVQVDSSTKFLNNRKMKI
jgi:hypothetical protein